MVYTKCNYYLQGAEVIVRNDHKPLARFLNGKNTNNEVNRWGLELATYNINFGVDFPYCWFNLEEKLYSLEQYIGFIEDKLSTTAVVFFRSDGKLKN